MKPLPQTLFRAAQIRELERLATAELGIPEQELMERAGRAAFDELRRRWPRARRIGVICGGGNNGGDGYVVARLSRAEGLEACIISTTPPERLKGAAAQAASAALSAGVPVSHDAPLDQFDLLVDGILGTGLSGEARGEALKAIEQINGSGLPVLALDVPSGLDGETGQVRGMAVRASATLCFIGLKAGCFTGAARDYTGAVLWDPLGIPPALFDQVKPFAQRLDAECLKRLPPRPRTAHKGSFGHVLVVGGDSGLAGAVRMAGEAAARTGAGLVSVATRSQNVGAIVGARPELMVHGIELPEMLSPLLAKATVIAVGPGLGSGEWGRALLGKVLECSKPLVVDADAINIIAEDTARRERWILTPHPGEAARLLGCSSAEIENDRFAAAASLQASFGGVVVLKGAGTVVLDSAGVNGVCALGNPGMASGGMGDVLTGVIAALVAQGWEISDAARLGVCLHAAAGDAAARDGERGLLATDLMAHLRRLANPHS